MKSQEMLKIPPKIAQEKKHAPFPEHTEDYQVATKKFKKMLTDLASAKRYFEKFLEKSVNSESRHERVGGYISGAHYFHSYGQYMFGFKCDNLRRKFLD